MVKIRTQRSCPWFDKELKEQIKIGRKLERSWKADSKNKVKFNSFYHQRRNVANLFTNKENQYYNTLFDKHQNDYKSIFKLSIYYLERKTYDSLPYEGAVKRANQFNDYFINKLPT